jgi:phosphatidylinositol dimannoside acyltransferase
MSSRQAPRREQSAFLRRMAHWGALKGPQGLLRWGPPPIAAAMGLVLPEVRQRIVRNLRRIGGERSRLREQLDVMQTLGNYAACFTEAMAAQRPDATPRTQVRGEPRLREALARGGVVIVTAHVGPWEMTAQLLGSELAANVVLVMEPEPNAAARELQDRWRSERGLRVLHVGTHPTDALPLISHLRKGGVAAMQMDRVPPSGRVLTPTVFGASFRVPEGPFRLAGLSGACVVPVFAQRRGFFDYELTVARPISVARRPSAEQLLEAAQLAADAMQDCIRESPTQWFHFADT